MITKYEEVSTFRVRIGFCSGCQKKMRKTKKFTHTLNPFNKNKNGTIKTFDEVHKCVSIEADKWRPDFTHDKCK